MIGITEKLIMDAIHDFSGRKTIIMIAHRLATVKHADMIVVMEHGEIIATGSHQQLLQSSPLYQRLCELQFNKD